MKSFEKILIFILLSAAGCTSGIEYESPSAGKSTIDDNSCILGEANVKFSEEMISLIEEDLDNGKTVTRSMSLNNVLDELGIVSMERIFPNAGEYEQRTRKEGLHRWYKIEFDKSVSLTRAREEFKSVDGVEIFEKQIKIQPTSLPFNDPYLPDQWHYLNKKHSGMDVNLLPVWKNYTTGDSSVIVAVVDQGIDFHHEDLEGVIIEKDSKCFVKDVKLCPGIHGTHVAGVIAAINNNGKGVCGVAGGDFAKGKKGARIISCQIFSQKGATSTPEAGIKWGADHGAVISQNSWGYSFYTSRGDFDTELAKNHKNPQSLIDAINYFIKYAGCDNQGKQRADSPMKGGLVVFSAGNDGSKYGAPGNIENVLTVGAIDKSGKKADYSNWGNWVNICAPGSNILSTYYDSTTIYKELDGTSMSCPIVSGIAALVISHCGGQGFTCEMLKEKLLKSSNPIDAGAYNIGPLVDAMGAICYGDTIIEPSGNHPPVISMNYSGPISVKSHLDTTVYFTVSDQDFDRMDITLEEGSKAVYFRQMDSSGKYQMKIVSLMEEPGNYSAKIKATDFFGASAEKYVEYVILPNHAPECTKSFENVLLPRIGDKHSIQLDEHFIDTDGEQLQYSVENSSKTAINATISDGILTCTSLSEGEATIKLTATDIREEKAVASFRILSRDPKTKPVDLYPIPANEYINIRPVEESPIHLELFSSVGGKILEKEFTASYFEPFRLDVSEIQSGYYTAVIKGTDFEQKINLIIL